MIIMDAAAERRLADKSAPPVTIGVASSVPRSGQAIAAWGIGFLGWNAKWVVGYRGTSALMLALQQGELDMTATSNTFSLQHLIDSGKFKVLVQSGGLQDGKLVPRRNFPRRRCCPTCSPASSTRSHRSRSTTGAVCCWPYKWLGLPPGTPNTMVEAYRKAYRTMAADPEFLAQGRRISEVFAPMTDADIRSLVQTGADTPHEAIELLDNLLRRQGIAL